VYPLEELTAEMNSLSRSLLILLVVSLSILLIAITIITKSMTKPLTELAIATTHFAKGELDIELPQIGSNDEIGNLNKAFIFMREELRHRIGELKEAYQELWVSKQRVDEYTKSLEEKVDERTKEVLIEAKELRTPLYTISSSVEILQLYEKQIDEEEKKHQFKQIECAVDEIVELLNDVISINRAEIGKINLKYERFDIVDFGKSILEEVLLRFDKSPKIIFSSIKDSFEIDSDKKEIKQIISNLLINAHKYTPEDKKVYFHISKDEGLLIIEVKDEGIGIPESDKANLFEPFARGNNVAKIHGTGLGLAITKRSIETLGGAIFFQSREGVGSVFVVKIPLESVVDLKINNT
jgi:signal transduction histidine kinase